MPLRIMTKVIGKGWPTHRADKHANGQTAKSILFRVTLVSYLKTGNNIRIPSDQARTKVCADSCARTVVVSRLPSARSNDAMSIRTKLFVGITASMGVTVLCFAVWPWQSADLSRFFCYLAVAVLASGLKVQLPGIDGTMSVNFLFILLGVLELSFSETLVIGCTASLVQSVWQTRKRLDPVKVLFNVAGMMANASALTYLTYHWLSGRVGSNKTILLLVAGL